MKILVLSDSHSAADFMYRCMEAVKPDVAIHLGDYVRDGEKLASAFPQTRFLQVAGNCDHYRVAPDYPEVMVERFCGVRVFLTHGHLYGVKQSLARLMGEAKRCGADIVLYGHTHIADCRRIEDGLWVVNPGSSGSFSASAAILTVESREQIQCRIIRERDLEGIE